MKKLLVLLMMLLCLTCAAAESPAQIDLPLPDASLYVTDPFLREVTQLMIVREEAARADWGDRYGVEWAKTTTLVTLHLPTVRMDGDRATVFARVYSARYALWEGEAHSVPQAMSEAMLRMMTGSLVPSRIELEQVDGAWQIISVTESQDGTLFWPSILEFCDGDELLAATLTVPVGSEVLCKRSVCAADGKPAICWTDVVAKERILEPYTHEDFQMVIFNFLQEFCHVNAYMDLTELHAVAADAHTAAALEIPVGTPLLNMEEVDFDIEGNPIFYSDQYFTDGMISHTVLRKKL